METAISKVQKYTVLALAAMLIVVMILSTVYLGTLIGEETSKPARLAHTGTGPARDFWVLPAGADRRGAVGTLQAYVKKDVIHVRVVLEVALIAMARKVIIEEPNTVPSLTLFGIAALIFALGIAFFFERQAKRETGHGIL